MKIETKKNIKIPFPIFNKQIENGWTFKLKKNNQKLDRWELYINGYTNVQKLINNGYAKVESTFNPNWENDWNEEIKKLGQKKSKTKTPAVKYVVVKPNN